MCFAKELLLRDVAYSAWANQRLLAAGALIPGELERELGTSHASILDTLCHIYDGERVWLLCLRDTRDGGDYLLPPPPAPKLAFDTLRQKWPKHLDGYRRWLEPQSEASLKVELRVQLPGSRPNLARGQILRHVLDHSQFHRGQIIGMIRSLGQQPPAINRMDYWLAA